MKPGYLSVMIVISLISVAGCGKDTSTGPSSMPESAKNPFADYDTLTVADILNLTLAPDCGDYLKQYSIQNASAIAEMHHESGMIPFYDYTPNKTLDENDIPYYDHSSGIRRNPAHICHTALGFYTYYTQNGLDTDKQSFFNNVGWLLENCDEDYYLRHQYPTHHNYELPAGWVSAIAQGEAVSVMCRAYDITGDEQYLAAATGFHRTLYSNTEDTWVFFIDQKGSYWLEEYPTQDFCHMLIGYILALWGHWDYYMITGDELALTLFQAGLQTILDNIDHWNIPGEDMSMACSHIRPQNYGYHLFQIEQLQKYADVFDIPEFEDAIEMLHQ